MKREASINGDTRPLHVEAGGATVHATWGQHAVSFDLLETEPGTYSVLHQGRAITVTLDGNGKAYAGGREFAIEIVDPRNATARNGAAGRSGQVRLIAPMPGKVIRILAAPGQSVTAGQGLIVVEAMKMQNEMKAPRDAQVVSVDTQESATVGAGQVLMVLE